MLDFGLGEGHKKWVEPRICIALLVNSGGGG